MNRLVFFLLATIILVSGCGPNPSATEAVDIEATAEAMVGTIVAETMLAIPSPTLAAPTQTQIPATDMPIPTATLVYSTETPAPTMSPTQELVVFTPTKNEYGPNFVQLKLVNNSTKGCYWIQFAGGETYEASVCSKEFITIRKGTYAYVIYFGLQRTYEGSINITHKDAHTFEVYDDRVKFIVP